MYSNMTKDEAFAEALFQIIDNQILIKKHLGIIGDYDGGNYYDKQTKETLDKILRGELN